MHAPKYRKSRKGEMKKKKTSRLPREYFRHKSRFIEIAWNVFVSRYKLWVLRHSDTHVSKVKHNDERACQRTPEYNFKRVFFDLCLERVR